MDDERQQLFLSQGGSGTVEVVDLATGDKSVISTGHSAEFMHFDPVLDQVAISLAAGDHSYYWWDEDQEGYVAVIDAKTRIAREPIWIPFDPWQVVADGTGHIYAGGASGQWSSIISVDTSTGWATTANGPFQGTSIQLHKDRRRIYGADNGLSPSDIERWDISNGSATYAYDSPYRGDYPICGDLRIHPSGDTIYTRCGHVFLASNTRTSDMTWVADMKLRWNPLRFGGQAPAGPGPLPGNRRQFRLPGVYRR